jgi:mevalonate kinase
MFPCKLLLFGEYTILDEGAALAVPLKNFNARWSQGGDKWNTAAGLWALLDYLHDEKLTDFYEVGRFEEDLQSNWWLDASIPQGYGLGSSGAVAAAVYHQYKKQPSMKIKELRQDLAILENCWHKTSSGIDPLVSYLHRPIYIQSKEELSIKSVDFSKIAHHLYLLDTKIKRSTAPLVSWFLLQSERLEFKTECVQPLKLANNEAAQWIINNNMEKVAVYFKQISILQYQFMQHLIPANFMGLWKEGLDSGDFYLKICGAGAGGFLLLWEVEKGSVEKLKAADYSILNIEV